MDAIQIQAQVQNQKQQQQQIISQNYANNILFMNLSCLETLQQKYFGISKPKFFGAYDIVDYSHRSTQVLKEQLRLGLYQVQISYNAQTEDGKNKFVLPKFYNMDQVLSRLKEFECFFKEEDSDCQKMVKDLQNILKGQKVQNHFSKLSFKSEQSQSLLQKFFNFFKVTQKIEEQQRMVKENYSPNMQVEDIPFRINPHYQQISEDQCRTKSIQPAGEKQAKIDQQRREAQIDRKNINEIDNKESASKLQRLLNYIRSIKIF